MENELSSLNSSKKSYINEAKSKAKEILLSAKEDANDLIKQIEKSNNTKSANEIRNTINKNIDKLSIKKEETKKISLKLSDLTIGMEVFIPSISQTGTILSASKESNIQVQLPLGKMFFNIN